jgi:hypothetical protein
MVPVDLTCSGGAGAGQCHADACRDQATTPVEVTDPARALATIQLENNGIDTLSITTISIADNGVVGAAADWAVTVDGPCADLTAPCMLAANQVLNVRLTFNPSTFNGRPARMIVNYTDPATKQALAELGAIGIGATSSRDPGPVPIRSSARYLDAAHVRASESGNRAHREPRRVAAPFMFEQHRRESSTNPLVTVTCRSATSIT